MHKFTYLFLFVMVQLWTIFIHDGDMITGSWWEKWINSPAHHTLHHLYFTCNYGQVSSAAPHLYVVSIFPFHAMPSKSRSRNSAITTLVLTCHRAPLISSTSHGQMSITTHIEHQRKTSTPSTLLLLQCRRRGWQMQMETQSSQRRRINREYMCFE